MSAEDLAKWKARAARHGMAEGFLDGPAKTAPEPGEPDCETCGNMRYLLLGDGITPCPTCRVAQTRRVKAVDQLSGANAKAEAQTFASYKPGLNATLRVAWEAAREFAADPRGKWLVFYGPRGTGKTHLCAAIMNERRRMGQPAAMIRALDLLGSLKATFEEDPVTGRPVAPEGFYERLNRYKAVELLIVDDLGTEKATEWASEQWFAVLDSRYMNALPTVISTNYDATDKTGELFDPRLVSRWCDVTAGNRAIYMAAPDFRQGGSK